MDFTLQDKFCDAKYLRDSWEQFCIPDKLITFFGTLLNINYATLKSNFPKTYYMEDDDDVEQMFSDTTNGDSENEQVNRNYIKIKTLSLIQTNVLNTFACNECKYNLQKM